MRLIKSVIIYTVLFIMMCVLPANAQIVNQVKRPAIQSPIAKDLNKTGIVITPIKPDLIITGYTVTPTPASQGVFPLTFTIRFKNVGTVDAIIDNGAKYWDVTFSLNGKNGYIGPCQGVYGCSQGSGGVNTGQAFAIPPGAEQERGVTISNFCGCETGTYTVNFSVDPDNRIDEINENNNTAPTSFVVTPSQVDLIISSLTITPPNPSVNTVFNLAVTIKNQGSGPAQIPAQTTLLTGRPYTGDLYMYNGVTILPGETKTYTMGVTSEGRKAGTQTWVITLDPGNKIYETNKTNNKASLDVTVK